MNQENISSSQDIVFNPATINERFIAYVVDLFPFALAWVLSLWSLAHSASLPQTLTPIRISFFWIGMDVLYNFFGVLIGGTIGKRWMGIVVVDGNGHRPGILQSLIRAVGQVLSSPLFDFGFLIALIRSDSRALHDLMAGTVVVQIRPKSRAEASILFLAALCVLVFLYGFILHGVFTAPSSQDVLALKKSADALYVLAQIEESYKAAHGTYSDSLADLAVASGNAREFRDSLREMFHPNHFRISVGDGSYRISARSLNRQDTRLILDGPPPRVHR